MSGRTKRILYNTAVAVAGLAAYVCVVLMALIAAWEYAELPKSYPIVFIVAGVTILLLKPEVIVHELGHLLFGAFAGMKFVSVSVGWLQFSTRGKKVRLRYPTAAGESCMVPAKTDCLRKRAMIASLGGATLNFAVGIVFCVLFIFLHDSAALLFFELLAPLQLFEGIAAMLPAETNAGKTDGALFVSLKNHTDGLFLRVLEIQGLLEKKSFGELSESLFFDVPVVREDDPAFLSFLQLKWQYLLVRGDVRAASEHIERLRELSDYLPQREAAEIGCDAAFMKYVLSGTREFSAPPEAKGTLSHLRLGLVCGEGKEQYYKAVQRERSYGIRDFEKRLSEKYFGIRFE